MFADAELDDTLNIYTDVRVKTGAKVLGKCRTVASKTVGMDIDSTG